MLRTSFVFCLLFTVAATMSDIQAANVGDPAPDVTVSDEAGNKVNLASFKGKSGVVVFFYPKADTPGCTKESCNFRDEIKQFTDKGYAVFGASRDSVEDQLKFKQKYNLNYPLLADTKGELATALGLKPGARHTAIISKEGKIEKQITQVAAATHASDLLKDIK